MLHAEEKISDVNHAELRGLLGMLDAGPSGMSQRQQQAEGQETEELAEEGDEEVVADPLLGKGARPDAPALAAAGPGRPPAHAAAAASPAQRRRAGYGAPILRHAQPPS